MRRYAVLAGFAWALGLTLASAQTADYTQLITLLDPSLTVTYTTIDTPNPWCRIDVFLPSPQEMEGIMNLTCVGGTDAWFNFTSSRRQIVEPTMPRHLGPDSTGVDYLLSGVYWSGETPGSAILYKTDRRGVTSKIATITVDTCPAHTRPPCASSDFYQFSSTVPVIDPVEGTITIQAEGRYCNIFNGCNWPPSPSVIATISGLPKLLDTVLTFVPGGQTLAIKTASRPDGFRSADTLQVWAGNVRSLPNYSQAQPVSCTAATNPAPGQIVSIMDSLPDPPRGEARYYVVASQSGTQRRLGRQYVGGGFSARDPSTLPVCQ